MPPPCSLAAVPSWADGVYIGRLDIGPKSARIALVVADQRFIGYVCSDDDSFNERCSRWVQGTIRKNGEMTAAADGVALHAVASEDRLRGGWQAADGEAIEFRATRIPEDSEAGLFRYVQLTDDERVVDGWIVDEEGNVVGDRKVGRRNRNAKGAIPAKKESTVGPGKSSSSKSTGGKAARSNSSSDKKPAKLAGGVGSSSSSKKRQELVSSKKLGDRLKSSTKKSPGIESQKGTAKDSSAKTEGVAKTGAALWGN